MILISLLHRGSSSQKNSQGGIAPSAPSPPSSVIPVLKIISVLVSIKFELNHYSISFYTVSEFFSVLVSIQFLDIISVQFQYQYLHHFSYSFLSTVVEHKCCQIRCPTFGDARKALMGYWRNEANIIIYYYLVPPITDRKTHDLEWRRILC